MSILAEASKARSCALPKKKANCTSRLNETMKLQTPPEVKIAFIGSRQSGKSSLVNCILKGKYDPAIRGISTFGINSFRVVAQNCNSTNKPSATDKRNSAPTPFVFGSSITNEQSTSSSMSPAITNEFIGLPGYRTMHVMTTDVPLQDDLFDMNLDTSLVLTDVPGIDTQDSQDVYLQYVNDQWNSFDCFVVVLSALEDVLLQLDILHLVKENLIANKEIPVVFVCNKVDDMMNQKVMKSFEQLRKLVKSIFMMPVIPLSAENAYVSCCSWTLQSLQELVKHDPPLFGKISTKVNHNWRCSANQIQNNEAALKLILTTISNEVYRSRNLASSNFQGFQSALSDSVLRCKEQKFPDEKTTNNSTH